MTVKYLWCSLKHTHIEVTNKKNAHIEQFRVNVASLEQKIYHLDNWIIW